MRKVQLANVSQLTEFDDIIDVRTPAEFALDHIPNAINAPVLNNEERVRIGTLYKQASPFEAKREGAALIARNIAHHLETLFHDRPREWQPLVYCWRGGKRSGSMAHIFAQIGWRAAQLDGGYKSFRRHVIDELETLPSLYKFRVVCGATGSGKSRLLQALDVQGAQVLDLEKIARHRGSLLGNLPDEAQPAQKMFETQLWETLRHFDVQQPVFVEAESRKIGNLAVPTALLEQMRQSECIAIDASISARVQLLTEDYQHFLTNPDLLSRSLKPLLEIQGKKVLDDWHEMATKSEWSPLVEDLLSRHYDPAYQRSTDNNYPQLNNAHIVKLRTLDEVTLSATAQALINTIRTCNN
ncbi:MAG: tRNA 2-selenouridine(34) synthase MnmH [Gallionellaceae bacterium]